jgi:hypothetical protein
LVAAIFRRGIVLRAQFGVQIARYRLLEQEVTDPLAAGLLHIIISELEADIDKGWEVGQRKCQDR